ncbi:enoyl-CoA hydratase-related protein [Conexibacter sp. JD483]|uniref:enoyl-CoA hydratase/isomerase family protein n=1 Tax=unclassified Conexibacter TaxID=2627773 RepID=UPI00272658F5|nr:MULTISPECIES: enoyl-CoA hydratase-related protein [unclassified Conexibacter]MDO8187816.1 enoyl-CoA hydratase-related protein [Conexibacter sp. CPCC 205706]MDO8199975.1 enoyl-CoA hydratase-related protein [Conexibacter sp. CPCC 205762]MDR9369502.1 enoyl-CoA hydratase-related protein [Conexibacter sp. JD483]
MNDVVTYEVSDDAVAWLTIDREEARNALSQAVRDGLWAGFRRFAADDDAAVLVLTGAGEKAFCAGGDLKEMSQNAMQVPPPDFLPYLQRTVRTDKPVIAAVNGVAFAGGFLLAQMCDLVIAAEHATFGITEVRVGRGSPWAAPLPWLVGPRAAMEIMLTGAPLSAARAYELGLVNRVVPAAELRAQAQQLAAGIAANAPLSVRAAKQLVYLSAEHGWSAALDAADELYEPVYLSDDAQEGPRAFKEKRAPRWTGR